jgi:ribosomal protein L7/L12
MSTIKISGWQQGMRKISLTKLLQERGGLGVKEAKALVDNVLAGREAVLDLPTDHDADVVADEIRDLGAICEVRKR